MTTDSVDLSDRKSSAASFSPRLSTVNPENSSPVSPPEEWQGNLNGLSRKSSGTSITIRLPRNPSLPQGTEKRMSRPRIRAASPQPVRLDHVKVQLHNPMRNYAETINARSHSRGATSSISVAR
ncbi:unnamed protein product [Clonostachys chloroleuca]|uniref:Uncharacterized protein n=1 Tax=Clonostachys chloroleuca TaxID=1926264 RepID=A0AA35LYI9_9HYPO|nr:unnamed protein product [Clonostachys chloroleuca]